MQEKIKLAIIGCGGMGRGHVLAVKQIRESGGDICELTAVCDVSAERARNFARMAQEFQKRRPPVVYTDYREMLEKESLDAVDIATDHRSHHIIGIDCLEAGLHVIVEKPMTITIKAGRKLVETAERVGKVVAVAENYRRGLSARALKFAIDEGYIGTPQMVLQGGIGGGIGWGGSYIVAGTAWRHHKLEGGDGPILDNGVHDCDLFYYLLGDVEEAYGAAFTFEKERYRKDQIGRITERTTNDLHDGGFAILKFACGAVGQWAPAYWAGHGEGSNFGRWIYGSNGVIKGDEMILDDGTRADVKNLFNAKAADDLKTALFPLGMTESVALEVYDFLQCIQKGRKPETDGYIGLKAMAIAYAVVESSHFNCPLKVKDVESGKVEGYQKEINESLGL